ncbi:type VII secretion target [Micromonospora sp. NPDC050200]|uniref:type VII secretion target n=1 Tax=Micromonospora sp. NPDC050200 TaxID=3155664 RepID=UPI0033D01EAB
MPDPDGIRVAPADLAVHAAHLDEIADAVRLACGAGRSVRAGADSYGQLCAVVPMLLDQVQGVLVHGLDAAARSVRDTAGRVRTAAARYEETDGRADATLRRLRRTP